MTNRIPNPPLTLHDKLRELRRDWIDEEIRHDKELAGFWERLNKMIKETAQ